MARSLIFSTKNIPNAHYIAMQLGLDNTMRTFTVIFIIVLPVLRLLNIGSPVKSASLTTSTPVAVISKIAFTSNRDGYSQIYVMDADGTNQYALTNTNANNYLSPGSWSPDGKQLIFASERDSRRGELYVMESDGSNIRRLTKNTVLDWAPDWSPDGKQLVFTSNRNATNQIYVMNADGSNIRQLTADGENVQPSWSPDGNHIIFASRRPSLYQIYLMNADGSNERRLLETNYPATSPVWSPDKSHILFAARPQDDSEIFTMDVYGSDLRQLTFNGLIRDNLNPTWSSDSKQVIYQSTSENGDYEIFIMNADGSNPRNLTKNKAHDYTPSVAP
jgi:Tol biopolymer transport system component